MNPEQQGIRSTSILLAVLGVVACSAGRGRPPQPSPREGRGERVVVLSQPRGALIVHGEDTLAPAPVAFLHDRTGVAGIPNQIHLVALPNDTGQCVQHRTIAYDEATPDTVRFDMRRCPSRIQDLGRVFEDSEVTTSPERIASPPARYPEALRQAGIQGTVILRFVIDTTGRADATSMEVVLATHREFAPIAREVCLRSTYEPGRLYDRKVRVRARVPISFTIARAR